MAAVFRCTEPFAYDTKDGIQRVLRPGDIVVEGDDVLEKRAHLFEQIGGPDEAPAPRPTVEDASADPGTKRTRSRARKTAKKAAPAKGGSDKS